MSAPRRPPCAVTGLWPPASRPSGPPADHLGLPVRPATYTDSPIADVIWDCLAGEGDALASDVDAELVVDGDVHDLAAHPVEVDAPWDEADRLLERVCRRPTILPRATPEATHYARAMVGGLRQIGRPNTSCATCGSLLIHGRARGGELLAQCGCTLATRAS